MTAAMHKYKTAIDNSSYPPQRGAALLYIFIAIGLMAVLTASLINTSSSTSQAQQAQRLAATIESQITYIRSAILECVQTYPAGDPTVNSVSTTDLGYTHPYPLTPNSTHFTGSTLGPAASNAAGEIRCPGNPGTDNNHTPIFKGVNGRFAPNPPDVIETGWNYNNSTLTLDGRVYDGVSFYIKTSKTDAYVKDAFQIVDAKFNSCEVDYIVGDGTNGCTNNYVCLVYWLKRNTPC